MQHDHSSAPTAGSNAQASSSVAREDYVPAPTPHDGPSPPGVFSRLQLAPATRVVTTTTTTTVHFPPILIPHPGRSTTTRSNPTTAPGPSATADFSDFAQQTALRQVDLDPRIYRLAHVRWPGELEKLSFPLGDLQGTLEPDGAGTSVQSGASATATMQSEADGAFDGPSPVVKIGRGPSAPNHASRRSRTGLGAFMDLEDISEASPVPERAGDGEGIALERVSPGPPRKRPRSASQLQRARSSSSEAERMGQGAAGVGGARGNGQEDQFYGQPASPALLGPADSSAPTEPWSLDSGHTLTSLLSLPDFVATFDQLPAALQSYCIFSLLQRSPIPVLQTLNNIIAPALRRDFLADLPPELSIHILGFLDLVALCRASSVCKGWRGLVDGEWRVWQERLVGDGLWIGDGSETAQVNGYMPVTRESRFWTRWKAGVWDNRTAWNKPLAGHSEDVVMDTAFVRPRAQSTSANLASPSSSRDNSPPPLVPTTPSLAQTHYVHPFKDLYRRRFVTRRNWATSEPTRITVPCHANNVVTCLQFDQDKIVSASDDHSINVLNTQTGAPISRLSGHQGGVWALQYVGNILVSGSTDRTVRVWDLDRGKCTHVFVGHTSTVRCLQIVEPENVQTDPRLPPIWEPPYPVIVTGSRDWSLRVWKLPSLDTDTEYHPDVPMSPTEENTDPTDNPWHLAHLSGHQHAVRALAAHGKTVVSGSYDCSVRVWDITSGECLHKLTGHTQKVYSVVYDHQRKQCASGSMDGTVRLWSTQTGQCLSNLDGHTSLVGLLGLSHQHLVSAAADATLRIWDPVTGTHRHTLASHSGAITCFQHDDTKVISGSDGSLKMWDVRTGGLVRDLVTDLTGVWQVSFDQRFCVAAVQRNGASEFEILDFGVVEGEELQSAAEYEEARLLQERGARIEWDGARRASVQARTGIYDDQPLDSVPLAVPRLQSHGNDSTRTNSVRTVRRVGSSRNLQALSSAAADSPLTSSPSRSHSPLVSSYQSRINAVAPPGLRQASTLPATGDDPFAAGPSRDRAGRVDAPLDMETETDLTE